MSIGDQVRLELAGNTISATDLARAALAGEGEPEPQQTSAGRPVALNDDKALTAIIAAALGGPVTTNQQ